MPVKDRPFNLHCFGIKISLQFHSSISNKRYLGYALRGMLGQALFDNVCIYDKPQCLDCALRTACAYPQVFKPSELEDSSRLPAYVLGDWHLEDSGQRVVFNLILLGSAVRYLELWLSSLLRLNGQLKLLDTKQGSIVRVMDLGSQLYLMGRGRQTKEITPLVAPINYSSRATVRFHSMLITKHKQADILFSALRTRIRRLLQDYGEGDVPLNLMPWQIQEQSLKNHSIRIVGKQRQVQGVTGDFVLNNISVAGFLLLEIGLYVHAGSETGAGFGRFSLSASSSV